jgi:hypothetical protein
MLPKFPEEDGEFQMTEAQWQELRNAMNELHEGGGWGCIRLEFKNHQLVFIKREVVKMVGSRTYDEY